MSRRSLGVPSHAAESTLPTGAAVRTGSMAWAEALVPGHHKQLRIFDGYAWRGVDYDQT
jgi:hypothetical protein